MVWKCHTRLPVLASSATSVFANRLSPGLQPPYHAAVGRRQRNVDVAELFVGGHRIPRAEIAGDLPRVVAPGFVAELTGLRHDVEGPEQLPGFGVEAADVLGRGFLAVAAVAGAGRVAGDDDDVADDQRSGAVVEATGERLAIGEAQAHASLGAKR